MSFKTRMEDSVRHANHLGAESEPGDGGERMAVQRSTRKLSCTNMRRHAQICTCAQGNANFPSSFPQQIFHDTDVNPHLMSR